MADIHVANYSGYPKCGLHEKRSSLIQDTVVCSNVIQKCINLPLKSGQVSNQDDFLRS